MLPDLSELDAEILKALKKHVVATLLRINNGRVFLPLSSIVFSIHSNPSSLFIYDALLVRRSCVVRFVII